MRLARLLRSGTGCAPHETRLCPDVLVRDDDRMLDLTDYELVWPPELFTAEAQRILGRPGLGQQAIDLLLREAFRDDNAAEDVSSLVRDGAGGALL
jgi:hypothetical protein